MSWTDDIRCLYCDGRLPLYRKITSGQFCSTAHRKAYWAEQERLAVERLHQTHDSLRAYRPKGPVEAILGSAAPEPELAPPPAIHAVPDEPRPEWMPQVNSGELPVASLVKETFHSNPRWMTQDRVAGADPEPFECENPLRRPVNPPVTYDCGFDIAGKVQLELAPAQTTVTHADTAVAPVPVTVCPISRLLHDAAPQTQELEPREQEQDPAPLHEALCALAHPAAVQTARPAPETASPLSTAMRAQLPLDAVHLHARLTPAALVEAGLRELPVDRMTMVPGPW